uniref:Uncharacterized protein n=1 Tax=Rhizophora mucronata TaxID=61149 RepID=A0A2P2QUJ8_RHIMU
MYATLFLFSQGGYFHLKMSSL